MELPIKRINKEEIILPYSRELYQQICNTGAKELEVKIRDPRGITHEQRKKIYAMFHDIGDWQGEPWEWVKEQLKLFYLYQAKTDIEYFSLSNCSVTLATDFINYLIYFCVQHKIPMSEPLYKDLDQASTYKYVYACIENRVCAVTGLPNADLHHIDTVGMGFNRNVVRHKGKLAIPLCREKHTEAHTIGLQAFFQRYYLCGVQLDEYLCKILHLKP